MAGETTREDSACSRRRMILKRSDGSMPKVGVGKEEAAKSVDLGEFSPFENDLLVQSELLIENQRERILRLKAKLGEAEAVRVHELGKCHAENRELKEANAKLRLEIDLLQGELVAQADNDDGGLLLGGESRLKLREKEAEIARLQSELNKLSEKSLAFSKLQIENEKLKETIESRQKGVLKEELEAEERLRVLRRQIGEAEGLLRHLLLKRDEARVAATAMVDSEFELMEARQIVEDQKAHIAKLQNALDAALRERTMIPPTVMVMKHEQPSREDKADAVDNWLSKNMEKLTDMLRKTSQTAKEAGGTGGGLAVDAGSVQSDLLMKLTLSVNSLAERQDLHLRTAQRQIAKAGGEFVCLDVKHTRLLVDGSLVPRGGSELIEFARETLTRAEGTAEGRFYDRLLGIHEKLLLVYEADAPDHAVYRLEEHKTQAAWDASYQVIVLRYERGPGPSDVDCHVFQMDKPDDFSRLFHALRYSHVVPDTGSASTVPDAIPLVNSCALVYATQDTPRGSKHNFAENELIVTFDVESNKVLFRNRKNPSEDKIEVDASSTILQADPISSCLKLWCYPTPTDESRRSLLGIVFFKPEDQYNDQLLKALMLKWKDTHIGDGTYRAPVDLPDLDALSRFSSSSTSSTSESEGQKATSKRSYFDPFVVADRCIKLFEKPEGKPLLILKADGCVATCDDLSRRFLITRLDANGVADDQFMFEFEDDEKYAQKKALLRENGFFDRKAPPNIKFENEVAVVEKGVLKLYKHYGTPDDQPFLTAMAASSAAHFDAERREIHLTEKLAGGRGRNMKLDCSSTREYENWKRALLFAGFIKEDIGANAESTAAFSNLAQYLFPIKMDNDLPKDRQYIRVKDGNILFFSDPADLRPVYSIRGSDFEVTRETASRLVRMRRLTGEPLGERIEVTMPTIQSFDQLIDDLSAARLLSDEKKKLILPKGGVVRFRPKGIQCWKNVKAYAAQMQPAFVVPSDLYFGEIDSHGVSIRCRPEQSLTPRNQQLLRRLGVKSGFTKSLKHNRDRPKWQFGLHVAEMYSQSKPRADELFKPALTYSFIVQKQLKPTKGGSLGSVFKGMSQRQLEILTSAMNQEKDKDKEVLRQSRAIAPDELPSTSKADASAKSEKEIRADLSQVPVPEHAPVLGVFDQNASTSSSSEATRRRSKDSRKSKVTGDSQRGERAQTEERGREKQRHRSNSSRRLSRPATHTQVVTERLLRGRNSGEISYDLTRGSSQSDSGSSSGSYLVPEHRSRAASSDGSSSRSGEETLSNRRRSHGGRHRSRHSTSQSQRSRAGRSLLQRTNRSGRSSSRRQRREMSNGSERRRRSAPPSETSSRRTSRGSKRQLDSSDSSSQDRGPTSSRSRSKNRRQFYDSDESSSISEDRKSRSSHTTLRGVRRRTRDINSDSSISEDRKSRSSHTTLRGARRSRRDINSDSSSSSSSSSSQDRRLRSSRSKSRKLRKRKTQLGSSDSSESLSEDQHLTRERPLRDSRGDGTGAVRLSDGDPRRRRRRDGADTESSSDEAPSESERRRRAQKVRRAGFKRAETMGNEDFENPMFQERGGDDPKLPTVKVPRKEAAPTKAPSPMKTASPISPKSPSVVVREADIRDVEVNKAQRRRLTASMKHKGFETKMSLAARVPAPTAPRRKTELLREGKVAGNLASPKGGRTKATLKPKGKADNLMGTSPKLLDPLQRKEPLVKKKGATDVVAEAAKKGATDVDVEAAKRRKLVGSMKHSGYKKSAGPPPKTPKSRSLRSGDPDDIEIPERPLLGSARRR